MKNIFWPNNEPLTPTFLINLFNSCDIETFKGVAKLNLSPAPVSKTIFILGPVYSGKISSFLISLLLYFYNLYDI